MTIRELLKSKDMDTYIKLGKIAKPKKEIELGGRPEELMRHNSYKRVGRRVRQVKWG